MVYSSTNDIHFVYLFACFLKERCESWFKTNIQISLLTEKIVDKHYENSIEGLEYKKK